MMGLEGENELLKSGRKRRFAESCQNLFAQRRKAIVSKLKARYVTFSTPSALPLRSINNWEISY